MGGRARARKRYKTRKSEKERESEAAELVPLFVRNRVTLCRARLNISTSLRPEVDNKIENAESRRAISRRVAGITEWQWKNKKKTKTKKKKQSTTGIKSLTIDETVKNREFAPMIPTFNYRPR